MRAHQSDWHKNADVGAERPRASMLPRYDSKPATRPAVPQRPATERGPKMLPLRHAIRLLARGQGSIGIKPHIRPAGEAPA